MRAVSFVDHLEFDFNGNISQNAIALGDVDNDGGNELVVGNSNGDLAVFKETNTTPWKKSSDLGMITAVGIGDIYNIGRNSLVVACGDGWCHIFDFVEKVDTSDTVSEGEKEKEPVESPKVVRPSHVQRIPANTKVLLVGDVNGDGFTELILGLTDRVVRLYRWVHSDSTLVPSQDSPSGKLVCLNKWEFANQIGTVTLNYDNDGSPSILVAHPGGTFIRLKCQAMTEQDSAEKDGELLSTMCIDYHPLSSSRMRNPNVSTEILGNIEQGPSADPARGSRYAVATLDGTLMLVQEEEIIWSLQVDHQLFSLSKLDVTGDGRDEVIACSWDGQTYIVNQEKHSVRFQFEDTVSSFCAGHYSLAAGNSSSCFVYTTFDNKVFLYYNIRIPSIVIGNFFDEIQKDEELSNLISSHGVDTQDRRQVQQLMRWCLYGMKGVT